MKNAARRKKNTETSAVSLEGITMEGDGVLSSSLKIIETIDRGHKITLGRNSLYWLK